MKTLLAFFISLCLLFGSCESDGPTGPPGQGTIRMSMVDAPASYTSINIVVTEVSVHRADEDTSSGWVVLNNSSKTYDLLALTNGSMAVIAEAPLYAGMYAQIRLKLGAGSYLVVNGVQFALDVSGNSECILDHPFTLSANSMIGLTLDFNAIHSVQPSGVTRFRLVPSIRVVSDDNQGSVSGTVTPPLAKPVLSTVSGPDTISTAANTSTGTFKLMAVPSGTYSIRIHPTASVYADTVITGVQVTSQQDKSLGAINLRVR